jgi:hypothetical protein
VIRGVEVMGVISLLSSITLWAMIANALLARDLLGLLVISATMHVALCLLVVEWNSRLTAWKISFLVTCVSFAVMSSILSVIGMMAIL